jgi:putative ABC transport system permease protein
VNGGLPLWIPCGGVKSRQSPTGARDAFFRETSDTHCANSARIQGACAGIGLGLAVIGLFGVIAYSVTLQMHDFGVRIALGAQSGNILSLVLRKGLWLVGTGIVLGLGMALLSVRIVQSELWQVSAFDFRTLVVAPLALLLAGMLACYIPARRAMKVDPIVALRHE